MSESPACRLRPMDRATATDSSSFSYSDIRRRSHRQCRLLASCLTLLLLFLLLFHFHHLLLFLPYHFSSSVPFSTSLLFFTSTSHFSFPTSSFSSFSPFSLSSPPPSSPSAYPSSRPSSLHRLPLAAKASSVDGRMDERGIDRTLNNTLNRRNGRNEGPASDGGGVGLRRTRPAPPPQIPQSSSSSPPSLIALVSLSFILSSLSFGPSLVVAEWPAGRSLAGMFVSSSLTVTALSTSAA